MYYRLWRVVNPSRPIDFARRKWLMRLHLLFILPPERQYISHPNNMTHLSTMTHTWCRCLSTCEHVTRRHQQNVSRVPLLTSHQTQYRSYQPTVSSTEGQQLVSPPGQGPIPPDQTLYKVKWSKYNLKKTFACLLLHMDRGIALFLIVLVCFDANTRNTFCGTWVSVPLLQK